MASMQELLQAFQMFNNGVKSFAISAATLDATKQVQQLNQQNLDEQEKLQAMNQLSQQLALRLTGVGADASQIESATNRIAPSLGAQYQAQVNKDLQESSQQFQREQGVTQFGQQKELTEMGYGQAEKVATTAYGRDKNLKQMQISSSEKIAGMRTDQAIKAAQAKQEEKLKGKLVEQQKDFHSKERKSLDALDAADGAIAALESGPHNTGIGIALGALARLGQQTGALTDTDIDLVRKNPSEFGTIARKLKLNLTGEALQNERTFYITVIKHLKGETQKRLAVKARNFGTVRARTLGADPEQFTQDLLQSHGLQETEKQQQQPSPQSPGTNLNQYLED